MSELMQRHEFLPAPKNAQEAMQLAETLAASQLIPKNFQGKPNDVFVAMMWSANLGVPVLQGIQGIAVINNKPSIYGDLGLAICMNSGLMDSFKEEFIEPNEMAKNAEGKQSYFKNIIARCTVKRHGIADPFVSEFSVEDALLAGLWNRTDPWKKYPKRMLQMRARAFALRNAFPDRLMGMTFAEEAMDIVDVNDKGEVTSVSPSKKMPQRKPKAQTVEEKPKVEKVEPEQAAPAIENNPASEDLFGQQVMQATQTMPDPVEVEHKAVVEPVMAEVAKAHEVTQLDENIAKQRADISAALDSMSTWPEVRAFWDQIKPEMKSHCTDLFKAKRESLSIANPKIK